MARKCAGAKPAQGRQNATRCSQRRRAQVTHDNYVYSAPGAPGAHGLPHPADRRLFFSNFSMFVLAKLSARDSRRPTMSGSAAAVPPLPLTPTTAEARIASYQSPRTSLYTPRTNREMLDLTGEMLSDALEVTEQIKAKIVMLSARAHAQRAELLAKIQENAESMHAGERQCPICMEKLREPLACANNHRFCGECLKSYRRSWPHSPRMLCPLCRVDMPDVLLRVRAGLLQSDLAGQHVS